MGGSQEKRKKALLATGAKTWWKNVCNAFKIQLLFLLILFRFTSLSLTTQPSISVNINISRRRKTPFLSHLLLVCSNPTSLWRAAASEQVLACQPSTCCTAPCPQHRHEASSPSSEGKHSGSLLSNHNPHSPLHTQILMLRGHLILDQAQLVNSWHHRKHLCGTRQGAAVTI